VNFDTMPFTSFQLTNFSDEVKANFNREHVVKLFFLTDCLSWK
jgi:hypothetical protein